MTDEQKILALGAACILLGLLFIRASFIAWRRHCHLKRVNRDSKA